MPYAPILTTLAYVLSRDGGSVLMCRRDRPGDQQRGKLNGLGGKLERDEDVVACIRREIREEAGIDATELRLRGTVNWPGFGRDGEDVFGFVFLVTAFSGEPFTRSPEGELRWIPLDRLMEQTMWPGDRHFLPLVFDRVVPSFHAVLPYRDGAPIAWSVNVV